MKSSTPFTEHYRSFLLVAVAVLLAGFLFAVDRFDILPLTGQATPTYGAMPSVRVIKKVKKPAKPSQAALRKALRLSVPSTK